ncbi:CoA transferase [Permianibacter sp. IMCC34836]|uniref:CaiB/BaiF CoA transferase family protein n=1 Tax=Permianibacter fluminis TaxID=2738515 RepID=UPI0015554B88|nr:CoA transferase [Permianibacter fluminis]NQD35473.1 CoA transferase [Permianibacter fluminis]
MAGLLTGVRVLDLSRILAGPWCTQFLADLGADVVKVEKPGEGDDTRRWGPPFLKNADGKDSAESAYFLATNRGKRSIAIDFASADGQALLLQLVGKADVLVENYKVGALAQYGLSYDQLKDRHPQLIYCSITGFGQTGPDADKAGYDAMIQARGGLMSLTGVPEGEPGAGPVKVGVAVADLMTGMYAASAISAALYRRAVSGEGEYIDLALFDTQVAWLANQGMNYLVGGQLPVREGSAHPNIVPYQAMPASDGEFMLAVGNDKQFRAFCRVAGRESLADEARFASNAERVRNRRELLPLLQTLTRQHSRQHWLTALAAAGVPAGELNNLAQVYTDPQLQAREMIQHLPHASGVSVPHAGNPLKLRQHPVTYRAAAPLLNADAVAIRQSWLGET